MKTKLDKVTVFETIKQGLVLILGIILISAIVWSFIWSVSEKRGNLDLCSENLGYEFGWKMGAIELPFTAKYLNKTHMACCMKDKILTSEGVLTNKCYAFIK